jgi:hypothetical protein
MLQKSIEGKLTKTLQIICALKPLNKNSAYFFFFSSSFLGGRRKFFNVSYTDASLSLGVIARICIFGEKGFGSGIKSSIRTPFDTMASLTFSIKVSLGIPPTPFRALPFFLGKTTKRFK